MSNNIGRSLPTVSANPPEFHRGRGPHRGEAKDRVPQPQAGPELASFGGGPRPTQSVDRFRGIQAEYESQETVSLEVKTDDGDTVSISFEALNRIQAGVYSARVDGEKARVESVSAESSLQVEIKVEGTLDAEEVSQITELLRRLVASARSGNPDAVPAPAPAPLPAPVRAPFPAPAPQTIKTGGLESLDSFQFAYDAYQRASLETLNAKFK